MTLVRFYIPGALLLLALLVGCDRPTPFTPRIEAAAAPSTANATPRSSSAVSITWVDNAATEDGVRVQRSASSAGPWETAATTGPNVTSYSDGGRASEQSVCYRVTAFNAPGDSPT